MTFEQALNMIRANADAFLSTGDPTFLDDNRAAWDALKEMGRDTEACETFTKEANEDMPS